MLLFPHWGGEIARLASGASGGSLTRRTQSGHIAPCLGDLILGRHALGDVELVEDVRVDVERHRRRVPSLASDLDHAAPFMDQQRDEAVAKVVGPSALQADRSTSGHPGVPVPVCQAGSFQMQPEPFGNRRASSA